MYHSDMPIKTQKEDLLGRSSFARNLAKTIIQHDTDDSLCIGLCGKWGSGKTSVVNMLIHEIENYAEDNIKPPIIVRFEPWNFASTDQLLQQFFVRLSSVLLSKEDLKHSNLAEKITSYSDSLCDLIGLIPQAGVFLSALGKGAIPYITKKLQKGINGKDISAQKEMLEQALLNQPYRFLIVIDDIDRLNNDQIRQVFQLVTAVAKFSRITYLLVFDRQVVSNALEKIQSGDGEAFLEKVIQIPISIPDISITKRQEILFERLNSIIETNQDAKIYQPHWKWLFIKSVDPFIVSLRDVNRLCNLVRFKMASIASEVDMGDTVALSTIEITYPKVYEWIKGNKSVLTGELSVESFMERDKSPEEMKNKYAALLSTLIQSKYTEAINENTINQLMEALAVLFPHWGNTVGLNSYTEANAALTHDLISHPDKFDRYFSLDITDVGIIRSEVTTALFSMNSNDLSQFLIKLDKNGQIMELFAEIQSQMQQIPLERKKIIIAALFATLSKFSSSARNSIFNRPASVFAHQRIRDMMQMHQDENWSEFIKNRIEVADWDMIRALATFIHTTELAYGRLTANGNEHHYDKILSINELESIEESFCNRVLQNIEQYDLLEHPESRTVAYLMEHLASEFYCNYLKEKFSEAKNILRYLSSSLVQWFGSGVKYELNSDYQKHLNDKQVTDAIEELKGNKLLFTLKQHFQNAAAIFYLDKEGKETYDEEFSQEALDEVLSIWKNQIQ